MTGDQASSDTNATRTGRRARTDVARTMILTAVLSVLLIGAFNLYQSREFLLGEVEGQLADVAASRSDRLERGIVSVTKLAEALAASRSTTEALQSLSAGFNAIDEPLSASEEEELRTFYADQVIGAELRDGSVVGDGVYPTTEEAQYVQYWYIATNPFEVRSELVDPGDGSQYSSAHAEYHPEIRKLAQGGIVSDVLLIDLDGDIVYSIEKRIDFGTSIFDGPHADSTVARAIVRLQEAPAGQAAVVDFSPYAPAGLAAEMWVVTLVRSGDEVTGAIAVAILSEVVSNFVTADGMWEETGLGDTGEVYIVGRDGTLRSESRQFLEDPASYVATLESVYTDQPGIAEAVEASGSTVLVQPVDSEPVDVAQEGDRFSGGATNYLNQRTEAISGPVSPSSLGWVVVAEVQRSEVTAPLIDYLWRLGVVVLLVIAAATVTAVFASSRLLKPIDPIVDAAQRVSDGDLEVRLPDAGRDEFAFLSGEFNEFVAELSHRKADVSATEAETTELLASVVPRRLVDKVMAGDRDLAEAMSNASLVAMTLKGTMGNTRGFEDLAYDSSELAAGMASIAQAHGAEQLSSSAVTFLFATGLDVEAPRIEDAVEFAIAAVDWLSEALESKGLLFSVAVGVASGDVVTGVMGTERLSVDVLGAPRQIAGALAEAADGGQVLVDAEIAGLLGHEYQVDRVGGLEDLAGSPLDAWQVRSRTAV